MSHLSLHLCVKLDHCVFIQSLNLYICSYKTSIKHIPTIELHLVTEYSYYVHIWASGKLCPDKNLYFYVVITAGILAWFSWLHHENAIRNFKHLLHSCKCWLNCGWSGRRSWYCTYKYNVYNKLDKYIISVLKYKYLIFR